jgi:hypothetical protein
MRKASALVVVLMLIVVGCSSSEPLSFDLSHSMEPPEAPFAVSGHAADDGAVCSVGLWVDQREETMDGQPLADDGWAAIFDEAVRSRSVAEAKSIKQFECGDGSGTITITDHAYLDFAVLDVTTFGRGETTWGTWTVEGTGDYDSLSGEGEVVVDWDEQRFHYVGDVET